ncbi:MAG: lipoyl(octanoyl) transferase LipB [Thermoplasmata archaeon]
MPRVVDWGERGYAESLEEMRRMARARRAGTIDDTLILVEHPPVVTVGVEGDDGEAARSGFPVVRVERGGRGTYHGPGQLVGYPIVDLEPRGRDVRRFVHDVEALLVDALAAHGVRAGHVSGRHGVWVDAERKIASIGIAVEHWVTFHGFALNVDLDLAPFGRFHPCGLSGELMTSLAREVGHPVVVASVKPSVLAAWNLRFGRSGEVPTVPRPAKLSDAVASLE